MHDRIFRESSSTRTHWQGNRRFEHWYVGNQVYFITARCRQQYPAFAMCEAQNIFWDRLFHYAHESDFDIWVVSLMTNHYHLIGYCKEAARLGKMMQRVHGSVAKLVNDLLPERRRPFWTERGQGHSDYFDGCLRDEKQYSRAYRYTLTQSVRHKICQDWRQYAGTRVLVPVEEGFERAIRLGAFLRGVPYPRYFRK